MVETVAIIGMGLIGSSLARGLKNSDFTRRIVAIDCDESVCHTLIDLNIADDVTNDFARGVAQADIVVLCVPVGAMGDVMEKIAPHLKKGAIITDVGSSKISVIKAIEPFLPDDIEFVPAHPIAGTEFSGPESGFATLFHKAWCILTPLDTTPIKAVEHITHMWEACGAVVEIMDAQQHDLILGITSHLPHLIAYTIVGTANDLEDDLKSDVVKFSASGFRDFTRIAASDPVMWRDVFLNNKDAVLDTLGRFSRDLDMLRTAIEDDDGDYLYQKFKETRKIRKEIIEQGQA